MNSSTVRKVIVPGTFDPLTNGHVHLIERAAKCFDEVIVAVAADTSGKKAFWSFEQRLLWVKEVFAHQSCIQVKGFTGLLAHFYSQEHADAIVRGVRGVKDFEYEYQLAKVNQLLDKEVETIFFPATESFDVLSSSMVREIFALGGDIKSYVPAVVLRDHQLFS